MRKICGIFVFSTLWFILPPNLSFCQSVEDVFPVQPITSDGPIEPFDRYDGALDIDLSRDPFGYQGTSQNKRPGTKHRTNPIHDMTQNIIIAQTAKSAMEPSQPEGSEQEPIDPFADEETIKPLKTIPDPFEPVNRAFFYFNDKLYFWLLKPVAVGYRSIFPQSIRIGVRNFFGNLGFPIRFVNCLLQGKLDGAGREITRFVVNTTAGMAGFIDVAGKNMGVDEQDEDFGQTLGFYGLGPGLYINWPILGASSLTDTVGTIADIYTQPLNYVVEFKYNVALRSYDIVNSTSLTIGEYEDLKRAALDPYVAVRDAYYQFRLNKIRE